MNDLSIVIPTHNRSKFLDLLLDKHVDVFRRYNIPVFIYNDASTDDADQVINKWKGKYHLITLEENVNNVVIFDRNINNV